MRRTERPELLDHVGWRLHQAFAHWKALFSQKMAERGCVWVAEARGGLMQHIGPDGISQNQLVQRSGLTKQAVQQHLDELTRDGVIRRTPDPNDARKKRVELTAKGIESQHIANDVKREIENEFRSIVGESDFGQFSKALRALAEPHD